MSALQNSEGVYSARALVGWYNGLPDFKHVSNDLHTKIINHDQFVQLLWHNTDELRCFLLYSFLLIYPAILD